MCHVLNTVVHDATKHATMRAAQSAQLENLLLRTASICKSILLNSKKRIAVRVFPLRMSRASRPYEHTFVAFQGSGCDEQPEGVSHQSFVIRTLYSPIFLQFKIGCTWWYEVAGVEISDPKEGPARHEEV